LVPALLLLPALLVSAPLPPLATAPVSLPANAVSSKVTSSPLLQAAATAAPKTNSATSLAGINGWVMDQKLLKKAPFTE
jgi:hypothetical protein